MEDDNNIEIINIINVKLNIITDNLIDKGTNTLDDELIKKVKLKILHDTNIKLNIDEIDIEDSGDIGISIYSHDGTTRRKITYKQVELEMASLYENEDETYSDAFDIIGSYVRGQKLIYMESRWHCVSTLNLFMFPAIFFSAVASVLAHGFEHFSWGSSALSSLNAFISFLLGIVNYEIRRSSRSAQNICSSI